MVLKYRSKPIGLRNEKKKVIEVYIKNDIVNIDGNTSSRCNFCNIVVHRTRYTKHISKKKHLENDKQFKMIIPECLIQDLVENKPEHRYNLKSLKEISE